MSSLLAQRRQAAGALGVLWLIILAGCAAIPAPTVAAGRISTPPGNPGFSLGSEIVVRAIALLGTPYQFGGDQPGAFDCSGLVRYIHHELGITVPRTALEP